jgi:RNA polymerase sigma-70 factor (ECF subfamily)
MTDPDLLIRRLERALTSMDATSRELFLAHRLDGFSYAEIAERAGLSILQIERHIADAIFHLDRELRAMEQEDGA